MDCIVRIDFNAVSHKFLSNPGLPVRNPETTMSEERNSAA
jgi:hypothetical protein